MTNHYKRSLVIQPITKQNNKQQKMTENKNIEEMKLAVVGGGGVGKSALTVQFIQNVFLEEYDPSKTNFFLKLSAIEDSYRKHAKVDEVTCYLEILDTAGQEEYKALRDQYMRNADGFLIVYSVIDRKTFEETSEFTEQICRVKDADTWPMVLAGNKCDLESERAVTKEEAKKYATEQSMGFIETSAKSRKNVDEAFYELVREVRKSKDKKPSKKDEGKKKGGCLLL
jgi:GTPase KRas